MLEVLVCLVKCFAQNSDKGATSHPQQLIFILNKKFFFWQMTQAKNLSYLNQIKATK
jgi:hypothetical protein